MTDVRMGIRDPRDLSHLQLRSSISAYETTLERLRADKRAVRKSWQASIAQYDERLEELRNEYQRRRNEFAKRVLGIEVEELAALDAAAKAGE